MTGHAELPTVSWIGWYDAGRVDRLGHEAIVTEFFHVVIPIWPRRRSRYLFRYSNGDPGAVEIPLDRRSVVLGYARTPVWMAALILGAGGLFDMRVWMIAVAAALVALGALLTWAAGTLSPAERERRELLHRVTGLGAPPELLPTSIRENARDGLADTWFDERGVGWRTSITNGVASEVLVAIAEYDRSPKFMIRARTNLIDAEGN